ATYALGHDAVGLSPALAERCHVRFGPPPGWGPATSPSMLAHLLMWRLRRGRPVAGANASVGPGDPPGAIRPHAGDAGTRWDPAWLTLTRAEQRARLPFDWWVERFTWEVRRDWWVHLPHGQTPLNAVATARNALAAGASGIITPDDPGPERTRLGDHWRVRSWAEVAASARVEGYALVALEQGGTPLAEAALPARAVLVAGHEVRGLDAAHLRACDQVMTLPQWGSVNSFNVASAVGLILDAAPRVGRGSTSASYHGTNR
ncbi:MAG: TrmH family RNA methyltransferase, partial [Actinomycetota bacterium]|nr:TrmH family RNA methyltransferase [Actinomycetota bacterium]